MNIFKNKWGLLAINMLISIFFSLLFSSGEAVLTYINVLFYMAAFYLSIMLVMIVLKGGFLNATVYSMRRVFSRNRKDRDFLDDEEKKPLPSERVNSTWISTFCWQGFFLGMVMVVFLIIYYL